MADCCCGNPEGTNRECERCRLIAEIASLKDVLNGFVEWDKRYPKNSVHSIHGEHELDELFKAAMKATT